MTSIRQLLPTGSDVTVQDVIRSAQAAIAHPLRPGSSEARAFCTALSQRLLNDARTITFPAIQALGYWLRPAKLTPMTENYLFDPPGTQRVPAGIVFQIPPGNVATLFGYTAVIALLSGNAAVIRLSSAANPEQELLLKLIEESLADADPSVRNRLIVVRYGHDDGITAEFSSVCDARLVWGGDETVAHIHSLPLPPLAREAGFADRFSAMALNADRYTELSGPDLTSLIHSAYNDIFFFDQKACSSPRFLAWIGDEAAVEQASKDFYPRLSAHAIACRYQPGFGENVAKLNAAYLAMHDLKPRNYDVFSPALSVITLDNLDGLPAFKRMRYGSGLLLAARFDRLDDLAAHTERRDQTLSHWGFDPDDIQTFASGLQGRGFDRIVPAGQAPVFDAVWDGCNLFDIMTRLVQVTP